MAQDWVRMRTDIYRDPRVSAMADSLMKPDGVLAGHVNQFCHSDMAVTRNVTRNAVVGALVSVWGVLRHRGKRDGADLVVDRATLETVDDIADLPGVGEAMVDAGWLVVDATCLRMPNYFEEYNSEVDKATAMTGAERQRRYRENRKDGGVTKVTKCDVTVTKSDGRIEKRREEVIQEHPTPCRPAAPELTRGSAGVELPEGLQAEPFPAAWSEWLAYRRERRLSSRDRTLRAQLASLAPLGPVAAAECVGLSIRQGWQGLFPERMAARDSPPAAPREERKVRWQRRDGTVIEL